MTRHDVDHGGRPAQGVRPPITAVLPYYGYARQDRKTWQGTDLCQIGGQLDYSGGSQRVLTMDLHAGQIQGFFDIPVDHLGRHRFWLIILPARICLM